jgi:hypothetical protein
MPNHQLYILEQPSSCSISRMCPSWPRCRLRLSLLLVSLTEHASCCHAQPSILLFISMGRVSHLTPSLLSWWLLTNVQVNIITLLYDTHGHIYITLALLFFSYSYTCSTLFGRPASSDSSRLTQLQLLLLLLKFQFFFNNHQLERSNIKEKVF